LLARDAASFLAQCTATLLAGGAASFLAHGTAVFLVEGAAASVCRATAAAAGSDKAPITDEFLGTSEMRTEPAKVVAADLILDSRNRPATHGHTRQPAGERSRWRPASGHVNLEPAAVAGDTNPGPFGQ
jgi:hypothetical protein